VGRLEIYWASPALVQIQQLSLIAPTDFYFDALLVMVAGISAEVIE
jgi:hypothetical protein